MWGGACGRPVTRTGRGRRLQAAAAGCGRRRDACGGGGPMSGRKAVLDQNPGVRNISLKKKKRKKIMTMTMIMMTRIGKEKEMVLG